MKSRAGLRNSGLRTYLKLSITRHREDFLMISRRNAILAAITGLAGIGATLPGAGTYIGDT